MKREPDGKLTFKKIEVTDPGFQLHALNVLFPGNPDLMISLSIVRYPVLLYTDSGLEIVSYRQGTGPCDVRVYGAPAPNQDGELLAFYPDVRAASIAVRKPIDPAFNCHGQTFGDSAYWVESIEPILADEYRKIEKPHPGCVAIYKRANRIIHSVQVPEPDHPFVSCAGIWGPATAKNYKEAAQGLRYDSIEFFAKR